MIAAVADTHAALWYFYKNPRLSAAARTFMDNAAERGDEIVLSAISLAEIVYLVERNRLTASAYDELKAVLNDPDYVIREEPLTMAVVDAMRNVARAEIPEMPDRIIAATALYLGVPVISRDRRIASSDLRTVW